MQRTHQTEDTKSEKKLNKQDGLNNSSKIFLQNSSNYFFPLSSFRKSFLKSVAGMMIGGFLFSGCDVCFPSEQTPNFEKLVNAIYKAEGGANTRHPYGILKKFKTTTPRQACFNTCRHAWRDYLELKNPNVSFLEFLAERYAPTKGFVANDPTHLNQNWLKNVSYFYAQ